MFLVELPSVLDIAAAADLKSLLNQALEANEPVEIEAGVVERIDASAIQLLLSFIQEAAVRGNASCWKNASVELKASADLIGLSEELMLI